MRILTCEHVFHPEFDARKSKKSSAHRGKWKIGAIQMVIFNFLA